MTCQLRSYDRIVGLVLLKSALIHIKDNVMLPGPMVISCRTFRWIDAASGHRLHQGQVKHGKPSPAVLSPPTTSIGRSGEVVVVGRRRRIGRGWGRVQGGEGGGYGGASSLRYWRRRGEGCLPAVVWGEQVQHFTTTRPSRMSINWDLKFDKNHYKR